MGTEPDSRTPLKKVQEETSADRPAAAPSDQVASPTPPSSVDPLLAGFELGDWRVDVSGNRLQRGTLVRPLRHKAMELLLLLARHAGRTVTRDEIVDAVWAGNRFVAPKAINTAVWTVRQALDDDPDAPRYLETIAKKGYRLIAPVRPLTDGAREPAPDAQPAPVVAPMPAVAPAGSRARPWVMAGAAAAALLIVLAAVWILRPSADGAAAPVMARSATPAPALPQTLTQEPGVEYLGALAPDGQRLAFAWWRGRGVGELYLRRLDAPAAPPQALSAGLGDVNSLAWAPDGRAIAFAAIGGDGRCTLWLQAMADGAASAPRALTGCVSLRTPILSWSPDGRTIVFSARRDGAGGLFAIAPEGGPPQRLTTAAPAAMPDHQPAWAPDGHHAAFVREDPADGTRDFYELKPGGDPVRLTTLKLHFVHGLTYAADGRDLVFSTTRQDTRVLLRWERATGQIVPLGLEGSAPARAADGSLVYSLMRSHVSIARLVFRGAPVRLIQAVASDRVPRPDPGTTRVAFVSRRTGAPELWLAAPDGTGAKPLTALGGLVDEPSWSADGRRLAFVGPCGPGRRVGLCVVRDDGSALRPLAADASVYGAPAWHPQRDEVWVTSDRGSRWQLWRFPAAGGEGSVEPTELAPGRAVQWSSDGSGFVYQPRGERFLRWRAVTGPQAGTERRIEISATGEELVDWQLGVGAITTLTRSDRERWRRIDLVSGRRQALGEHALGSFPERARFALAGADAVWVEVANTQVADLMRLR